MRRRSTGYLAWTLLAGLFLASADLCIADSGVTSWGYYWKGKSGIFVPVSASPALGDAVAVAGGAGHSLALLGDGTVVGWGDNTFGQASQPANLNRVVAIAAGDYHSLALRADGTVVAWGDNSSGQVSVPADLTNAVAICGGFSHSLALRADGTVVGWGDDTVGQIGVPAALNNVIAIAAANVHSIALKGDGTVVAWGNNFYGECNVPSDLTNAVAISAGGGHNVALTADGRIVGWGDNSFGQAIPPGSLSNVVAAAAGGVHNVALQADGSVIAWGGGTTVDLSTGGDYGQAVVPAGLTNVAAVAAGYIHSLALVRTGPPVITGPMVNRTVLYGSTADLRVSAAGAQPLTYQWLFNGTNLDAATNSLLELANIVTGQAGKYSVMVSNEFGAITSSAMDLMVAPLFITRQPQSQVTLAGTTVSLQVVAAGVGPFTYQWRFEDVDLPGATLSSLVLTNVQTSDAGRYSVLVSNQVGSVMSSNATLSLTQIKVWGGYFGISNVPPISGNVVGISGGLYHCLALRDDGTVVAWGDNYYGELNVPANLTNATAVSAGDHYSLALKADGTVVGWGWNGLGQTSVPNNLSNVVAISAATIHSLALKSDGTVVAWGSGNIWPNTYVPAVVPPLLSNVVAISAGRDYSMALQADGSVTAWGMVDGSSISVPTSASNVVAIAAGRDHRLALRADGTVIAWGSDRSGQIDVPAGSSNAVAIAAGEYHSLALRADGTVLAWGANDTGQSAVPAGLTNVTAIAAGFYHSIAMTQAGAPVLRSDLVNTVVIYGARVYLHVNAVGAGPLVYQWQCNLTNILGATAATLQIDAAGFSDAGVYSVIVSNPFGTVTSSSATLGVVPFVITQHPRDQFTSRGGTVTLSAAAASQLPLSYQWQFNGTNLPGATDKTLVLQNAQLSQAGGYCAVISNSLGTQTSGTATVEIGQVISWGDNSFGQTNLPPGLTNIVAVAAGEFHSAALRADGTVVGWGQVGTPSNMTNITALGAGWNYSLGLKADTTVVVSGVNDSVRTIPAGLSNVVAIAAGGSHCLALTIDGRVSAWGYNYYGQTNVPAGLSNIVAVAAGDEHSLALKADGTVVVWGDNDWGQLNVPAGLTNVVAIAAGFQHSLALRADGTLAVWGANYAGATNMPSGITDVIAISAGGHHNVALRSDRTLISWGDGSIGQASPPWYATNLVMVSAGAAHNVAILDSLWPLVVQVKPPAGGKNLQATQYLRIFNRSPFTYPAALIHIRNLPPQVLVLNATGLDGQGNPFIQSNRVLPPGASADLQIEYLTPDGHIPNVKLTGEVALPLPGSIQPISRWARQPNGNFLLEFNSFVSAAYRVQYTSDLLNWNAASPMLQGTGQKLQWVDSGPPYTESAPAGVPCRFYRVILAPQGQ
ncbi:MAG TPA: immunoglobulin domain-containing protein [Verrucomicrobiae bacterium]